MTSTLKVTLSIDTRDCIGCDVCVAHCDKGVLRMVDGKALVIGVDRTGHPDPLRAAGAHVVVIDEAEARRACERQRRGAAERARPQAAPAAGRW